VVELEYESRLIDHRAGGKCEPYRVFAVEVAEESEREVQFFRRDRAAARRQLGLQGLAGLPLPAEHRKGRLKPEEQAMLGHAGGEAE
jgi:hypothetical protein